MLRHLVFIAIVLLTSALAPPPAPIAHGGQIAAEFTTPGGSWGCGGHCRHGHGPHGGRDGHGPHAVDAPVLGAT